MERVDNKKIREIKKTKPVNEFSLESLTKFPSVNQAEATSNFVKLYDVDDQLYVLYNIAHTEVCVTTGDDLSEAEEYFNTKAKILFDLNASENSEYDLVYEINKNDDEKLFGDALMRMDTDKLKQIQDKYNHIYKINDFKDLNYIYLLYNNCMCLDSSITELN